MYKTDNYDYPMPETVLLQLTHKDVVLSFFSLRKKEVLSLFSGDQLIYSNGYFINPHTNYSVGKVSTRMRDVLSEWEAKGYHVVSSTVRFVVAWRSKEDPKDNPETAVMLPEIKLIRD